MVYVTLLDIVLPHLVYITLLLHNHVCLRLYKSIAEFKIRVV